MSSRSCIALLIAIFSSAAIVAAAEPAAQPEGKAPKTRWAPAVIPKPLTKQVTQGLEWLAAHQMPNGGWGQGEESQEMGGGAEMKDVASVADTSLAALALVRAGNTPGRGDYGKQTLAAVNFVCSEIERSDNDSIYVTPTRGTRVQSKLGPYIDTFLANLLLSEVRGHMPDKQSEERVAAALAKVLKKIQKNQREDGTWGGEGWATTLSQGLAAKGLNRAAQKGQQVDAQVRERAESYARKSFDKQSGNFSESGTAGVALYGAGAGLSSLAESVTTNAQQEADVRQQVQSAPTAEARDEAQRQLERFDAARQDLVAAQDAVVARLDDPQFIAGFGSNGGEEFLSYMNIGESLVVKGGDAWKSWDKSITENLNRVQNRDGSWSGHHCITGRTFCTSAALLVLMVDRTPTPIAAKIGKR